MSHTATLPPTEPAAAAPVEIRWTRGCRRRVVHSGALLGVASVLSLVAGMGLALTTPENLMGESQSAARGSGVTVAGAGADLDRTIAAKLAAIGFLLPKPTLRRSAD